MEESRVYRPNFASQFSRLESEGRSDVQREYRTGTTVRCCSRCRPNLTSCYRAPAMTPILGDFNEPPSTCRDAACACPRFEALADETINREWAGPANNERCEAGDIEQVDLITYRSEFRARRRHREELDRAEPIRQVHFKHGHQ